MKTKVIVLSIVIAYFRSYKFKNHSLRFIARDESNESSDWSEKWQQSRVFVKTLRNFCNVIKQYKKFEFFRSLDNVMSALKSLSENAFDNDQTFLKIKNVSRSKRFRNQSIDNLNDSFSFSSIFNKRRFFVSISSFFFISDAIFRRQTNAISTKKIIHHTLIESRLSSNSSSINNMIMISKQMQRMIDVVIDNYVTRHSTEPDSFESFDSFESQEMNEMNDDNVDNADNRWNVVEIDFFDLHYDDKSFVSETSFIDNISKNIYFRDVHHFITRTKKMTITREKQLMKNNLWLNLRDVALKWWTNELSNVERRLIKMIIIEQNEMTK